MGIWNLNTRNEGAGGQIFAAIIYEQKEFKQIDVF